MLKGGKLKTAAILAMVAGVMLLIAGVNGAATWEMVGDLVHDHVTDNETVQMIFQVMIIIGALGGLAVLLGGYLLWKEHKWGSILITLGVGVGLIGLIIALIVSINTGDLQIWLSPGLGVIGIVLSVIARMIAKRA